jgi:FimV-like protein
MPMRQRIFMLVVLLLVSHPVAASDAVQVGRYLTVAPIPTAEQLEPLSVIVNVRFPRSLQTVGGALQHLLPPSGYQLADTRHADPQLAVLMTRPLPEVHRQIGPMTLQEALTTLAGEGWQLEVDPVHRLVSFRLHSPLRERYAHVEPPVWTPEAPILEQERTAPGWFEAPAPAPDALSTGDRYGPVRHGETLLEIALHLVESQYWSDRSMARRGLVALLRANPDAFLAIDGTPNLNLLRTGAYLQIPAEREVLAIPRDDAERTIAQQHDDWQRYLTARAEARGAREQGDE